MDERFLAAAGKKKYKTSLLGIEKAPPDSETLDKATRESMKCEILSNNLP